MILSTPYLPPPIWQYNGHWQTIGPNKLRAKPKLVKKRERINTHDDDFLDIDWFFNTHPTQKLIILTHGLEGSSTSNHMLGMVKAFHSVGYDALAWNNRSCSEDWPRQPRLYFHGDTQDLSTVINHALSLQKYESVVLIGFSMGASITLKYLGTQAIDARIKGSVSYSCPTTLGDCADFLDLPTNRVYKINFMRDIKAKAKRVAFEHPHLNLPVHELHKMKKWRDFDTHISAPVWGFNTVQELYDAGSAKYFVQQIQVPSLLVNAKNDPMLPPSCMPFNEALEHPFFHFEQTQYGGHVGFDSRANKKRLWSEQRALDFLASHIGV